MKESIQDVSFKEALSERYLSYALSTIMARSLPDVRDGMKPVHRRLIYAMRQLKLDPTSSFKKCARVVGDVMGKFHPHGDGSIYDALVRLAQEFSVRYPLIDGQGNFGNIDGDNAAAMRYTESRLTEMAALLMEGIDEDAVDFRPTYDGSEEEPIVFPAAFPNILANGASGIAVGMATNIPPHNIPELCKALVQLIDNPNTGIEGLMKHILGPDLPTGGIIIDTPDVIQKAYETGKGSFRVRARWEVEPLKGGLYQIVVTEMPYQVPKAKLIEKIANLLNDKKLPLLGNIVDESAEDVRLVLEPKSKIVEPDMLMESLFRQTDLEVRLSLNMNVLDQGKMPRVMSLKEVLQAFLEHRQEVLARRSHHRLTHIADRLEVLEGYRIAYLNLDEVIRIIRDEDDPKQAMMERFSLTDRQVEAILNMRLRALRKLQEIEIQRELEALTLEKEELSALLADDGLQWQKIRGDIMELRKAVSASKILGPRRTTFEKAPEIDDIPLESVIEKEDVTVVCSDKGWIRTFKGHAVSPDELKYKDGDEERFILKTNTADKILIFSSNGKFYTLPVDKLPSGRGHGEPVRLLIDLGQDDAIIDMIVSPYDSKADDEYLIAAIDGRGFRVKLSDVLAQTKSGKQVMTLPEGVKACMCVPIGENHDRVAIIGDHRKLLLFDLDEIPQLARGRGVILQKYKFNEMLHGQLVIQQLSDLKTFSQEEGLSWTRGGKNFRETDMLQSWYGKRGAIGKLAPIGIARTNKFSS